MERDKSGPGVYPEAWRLLMSMPSHSPPVRPFMSEIKRCPGCGASIENAKVAHYHPGDPPAPETNTETNTETNNPTPAPAQPEEFHGVDLTPLSFFDED